MVSKVGTSDRGFDGEAPPLGKETGGVLAYWCIGVLVYWRIGVLVTSIPIHQYTNNCLLPTDFRQCIIKPF